MIDFRIVPDKNHINYELMKRFCKRLREKNERAEIEKLDVVVPTLTLTSEKTVIAHHIIPRKSRLKKRSLYTPVYAYKRTVLSLEQRARLINERGTKCQTCKRLLIRHFHHINGIPSDNRDENLLLLCIPCHKEADKQMRLKRLTKRYH
jgi:DNA-directed RNA polymerase subunit N (RpoN/RPB10)